ncbi:UDP-2,3-diacylglucosamine diphosphatase [Hydrogenimonas sp. SS33]|uniref:UDP-2,3-diacylglucosamine diphosphatase n=1 Tax=Hydrogenimonas leucolamina TaxID=2954236 RepID=UPI00336C11DC
MNRNKEPVELKEGAWFIADVHYSRFKTDFYRFLLDAQKGDLPPQIFLMGDIFDLLFGNAPNSIEPNRKMVDLLLRISRRTEMIYLEGNHDFGLKRIFGSRMQVVPRFAQPLFATFGGKRIALHHGDILQGIGYEFYTALIRNPLVDRVLNRVDTWKEGAIIAWLERYNAKKRPCYRIEDFETKMRERMETLRKRYRFDLWIDGHYHQDVRFRFDGVDYINLPAYACDRRYTILEKGPDGPVFRKAKDGNGIEE